ncbi:hypothetical protein CONCODRAFT_78584 [Conidiobolus coronatus NRRL 28638]|uniref:Transcription factor CBF/NF-Y/archaeal histone domain-containing protein n=1 Tax=Conidiobolus coronatus (strain ATCC 28846 / CBS 209.66 / NRRL 28638) TaxID=796925 RepID=A0A137P7L9_CONC2|nr:hypothetical protein CONCODRAFT_78584 [Conidiobolus coronatus NRRL 28638]|eukprot:KXN71006.1 hypothetical protein CONCODRAFT_78584 [Conidiobolus coronatus NRRL 28638]
MSSDNEETTLQDQNSTTIVNNTTLQNGEPFNFDPNETAGNISIKIPLLRIKKMLKEDPEINGTTREAIFAISKATELFSLYMATQAYNCAARENRLTVTYKDCSNAVKLDDKLEFLSELVPPQQSLKNALAGRK